MHTYPSPLSRILVLLLAFITLPAIAHADAEEPPSSDSSFESIQNLELVLKVNDQPLATQATTSYAHDMPLTVSYDVRPTGIFFGDRNYPQEYQDLYFPEYLIEQTFYLEFWSGEPFTPNAERIAWWPIDETGKGTVTLSNIGAGPYFFVAHTPNMEYRDLPVQCERSGYTPEECTPENMGTVTQDETSAYFALEFESDEFNDFEKVPKGWGGIRFVQESPTQLGTSNVLFLPGIKASRLYMRDANGNEQELWEPGLLADISKLMMREDGSSVNQIYTRDIVDTVFKNRPLLQPLAAASMGPLADVYRPFMDFMDGLESEGTIEEWRAFPYDWRHDVFDIVRSGTLVGSKEGNIERILLDDVLEDLALTSPTGKVTIVGHSNGGLLAKALAIYLEEDGRANLIDRIIMVGTPQYGTPTAIGSMLHGDNESIANGLIVYANDVRNTTRKMPGAYGLLPSDAYINSVPEEVTVFDGSPAPAAYRNAFGPSIDSFAELARFAQGSVPAAGNANDLRAPVRLLPALLAKAQATHARLDSWSPSNSLEVTSIVGWGQNTPYQLGYTSRAKTSCSSIFSCTTNHLLEHTTLPTEHGDGTVIAHSAAGMTPDSRYFDARSYQNDNKGTVLHSNLLSATPIQSEISDTILGMPAANDYLSSDVPDGTALRNLTIVSAHSPVNILATDTAGRQTGTVSVPGLVGFHFLKQEIPNSSVQVLGEEKYIYLPNDEYRIEMKGYGSGTTTLEIAKGSLDGTGTTTQAFKDIPTRSSTAASFELADTGTASIPAVDINGDGTIDLRPNDSLASTTQPSVLTLLKVKISSSKLPPITKMLLLRLLEELEKKLKDARSYKSQITSMQALVSAIAGSESQKDKKEISDLLKKF